MDENNQKADARSTQNLNQEAHVPSPRMLPDDGIHSGAAASNMAASGGIGAASNDTPDGTTTVVFVAQDADNAPTGLKPMTIAAFTKAIDNEEGSATASISPPADFRKPHPSEHTKKDG